MDSHRHRTEQDGVQEAEIRKRIAALQARLPPGYAPLNTVAPTSPPRKRRDHELAPATPSPRKKRKTDSDGSFILKLAPTRSLSMPKEKRQISSSQSSKIVMPTPVNTSNFLSKLASKSRSDPDALESIETAIQRSSAFAERPHTPPPQPCKEGSNRDDRLALIEELEPGPYDHTPSINDPLFQELEPHSGIRLLSRSLSHEDLQDYMRERYYLSPSRLYSAIRLLPDKQGYDVPVAGDWITIAVVAERGPLRFSRAPIEANKDEDTNPKAKKEDKKKTSGRKYVNIKLVDFGGRSSKSINSKSSIRGDAFLSLLLFEADSFDLVTYDRDETTGKKPRPKKIYKGGSRGAFEAMSKIKEGDVIALLNPRVLKPFQKSNERPHPSSNILAVTPESATSIEVIGTAKDLGLCHVVKRDGKPCNSWCDKRVSDVCDYHIQTAVEHRRASRPEFSIGTSGMSKTAQKPKKAHDYDPRKKWGLTPEETTQGPTFIVSGHVVNPSQMHIADSMGREAQAKAKRKLVGQVADKELKSLLDRDKDGMQSVMKAREVGKQLLEKGKEQAKGKKRKSTESSQNEDLDGHEEGEHGSKPAYSANMIKSLGFDPAFKPGQQRKNTSSMIQKLNMLANTQSNRKKVDLRPRSGPKIRSGVVVPLSADAMEEHNESSEDGLIYLDDL